MKLYGHPLSGHAHRVESFLKILGLEFESITVNLMEDEHKGEAFLKLNPLGQVPVYIDGDFVLRDSTAILTYLALKYDKSGKWLPEGAKVRALIQSWLAVSTKEVYEGPFSARLVKVLNAPLDYDMAVTKSHDLFKSLFEPHLEKNNWLVGDSPTIADIANYSYISVVEEGEVDLSSYPSLQAWLRRVEGLEGFEAMIPAAETLKG